MEYSNETQNVTVAAVIGGAKRTSTATTAERINKKRRGNTAIADEVAVAAADAILTAAEEEERCLREDGDDENIANRCTSCNIDMGENNPRQLCGKIRCLREDDDINDEWKIENMQRRYGMSDAELNINDVDDDVTAVKVDDDDFPSLEEMGGGGVQAFSSLDTETIYAIIKFEKRTEEFRGERKDNLVLTLRAKGSRNTREVRATGIVQKTLTADYKLESLCGTHKFYIRYLGQKKSQSGNMFCNFSVKTVRRTDNVSCAQNEEQQNTECYFYKF